MITLIQDGKLFLHTSPNSTKYFVADQVEECLRAEYDFVAYRTTDGLHWQARLITTGGIITILLPIEIDL